MLTGRGTDGLMPALANPLYKPTAPDDLMNKVDDVLHCANDVPQPNDWNHASASSTMIPQPPRWLYIFGIWAYREL